MGSMANALPWHYDRIGMAAGLLDADLRIIQANQSLAALLGGSAGSLTGERLIERLTATASSVTKSYDKSIFRYLSNGDDRWYRLDLHPEGDETLAILVDVTVQQLQIDHLRFTNTVTDQLMEEAQIGVWRYDPDNQTYYFASALSLGYNNAGRAIPLDRLRQLQHPDDAQADAERRERITTQGGHAEGEIRYRDAHGEWVHLRVHYRAGRQLPSGLYEMYGISQNITPQAAARDAARTFGHRLKLALTAARAAVLEYNYEKRTYWASYELASMVGADDTTAIANEPFALFVEEDRTEVVSLARRLASEAEAGWIDARLLTKDGPRWTRLYIEVERSPNGEPSRAVSLIIDIDDQKKQEIALDEARQAAEAAARAKSSFLATMSHEIRTPLNGVIGMAQALQYEPLSSGQSEQVGIILDSGNTLMTLLNDVLDLSKIEAGKLEIVPADDDLRGTIRRTIELFRKNASDKGLKLYLELDSGLPTELSFDAVRVRQCVSNLLSNAIKFTDAGGRVLVRLECDAMPDGRHSIRITISDTGIGIDDETAAKLFSAFVQADASTSRRFGGTGLGLAISRHLARLMGGDITVKSEPGKGASFTLTFVADAAAMQSAAKSANAAVEASLRSGPKANTDYAVTGARVLLVDDNAINRKVISLFLAAYSTEIREAENGEEALAALKEQEFDVVLLDIHMPIMDGAETIRRIRASDESWKDIPVIALTADAMSGDRERYLSMGADEYLSKPIAQNDLIGKMIAILSRASSGVPAAIQTRATNDASPRVETRQADQTDPLVRAERRASG